MSRRNRKALAACIKLAAVQHWIVTRDQARSAGLSDHAIQRLLRDGVWERIHPRTYSIGTPRSVEDRWRMSLMAGSLWLGEPAAISHRSAGTIWNLEGVPFGAKEFTTSGRSGDRAKGLTIHRIGSLPAKHITIRSGFRVTSLPWTVVALASVLPPRQFEFAFESALRSGKTSVKAIRSALEEGNPKQKGRRMVRRLLDEYPGTPTESFLEVEFWQLIRESPLPFPLRQHKVRDERGEVVSRPDFAYPDLGLAIEVDGSGSHSSQRDVARDREKDDIYYRLGWTVYRVTRAKLRQDPAEVIREIRNLRGKLADPRRRSLEA